MLGELLFGIRLVFFHSGLKYYLLNSLRDIIRLDRKKSLIRLHTSLIFPAVIVSFEENTDKAIILHVVLYRRTSKTQKKGCTGHTRVSYNIGNLFPRRSRGFLNTSMGIGKVSSLYLSYFIFSLHSLHVRY
jgi:hypothetical protein